MNRLHNANASADKTHRNARAQFKNDVIFHFFFQMNLFHFISFKHIVQRKYFEYVDVVAVEWRHVNEPPR